MNSEPQRIHEHGFVTLLDTMPDEIGEGDEAIVAAARCSTTGGTKPKRNTRGLIRYLMRHRHTSPLEQVELKFHIKAPIFVLRQWIRHRTWQPNEESGRYSELSPQFYVPLPDRIQGQSTENKQCSDGVKLACADEIHQLMRHEVEETYRRYQEYLSLGVSREVARMNLPLSIYSTMVNKVNLLNFFKFYKLRSAPDAQEEIRVYAEAMFELIRPLVPLACEAYETYWKE